MKKIRFLSFNLRGGRSLNGKSNLYKIHNLMERLNIDIGVFQEVETRPSRGAPSDYLNVIASSSRPYHLIGQSIQDDGGWYGNLIVSRYPILRGLVHNLETKPDLEPRNAVDALIKISNDKRLRLIGTHLSLSIFERWSEARNLIRLIQEVEEQERVPILLMGDINEWQYPSKLLRYLNSVMTPLPCRSTFPSFMPFLRLDRAWSDAPGLQIVAHRLVNPSIRLLSDHLPILVEIVIPD